MIGYVAAALFVGLAGFPIARALDRELRGGAVVGVAALLGFGIGHYVLVALSFLGVRWSRTSVAIGLILPALTAILWLRRGLFPERGGPSERWGHGALGSALLLLMIVLVAGHLLYATSLPQWEWDYLAIWGLKAKAFHAAAAVDWGFLSDPLTRFVHPDYPLLVPLSMDLASVLDGTWDERWVGTIYTAFGAALILILHSLTRRELRSDLVALLVTLALASPALSLWVGLAEGPLVAYMTAGLLFVRDGIHTERRGSLRTGAVLLGFAGLCKNEGLALIGTAIVGIALHRPFRWRHVGAIWPAIAIVAPWITLRVLHRFPTDFATGDMASRIWANLWRIDEILWAMLQCLPEPIPFWLAALSTLVIYRRIAWGYERFLLVTLGLQFCLYFAQNFAHRIQLVAHIQFSWARILSQIAVALGYLALMVLARVMYPPVETGASPEPEGTLPSGLKLPAGRRRRAG